MNSFTSRMQRSRCIFFRQCIGYAVADGSFRGYLRCISCIVSIVGLGHAHTEHPHISPYPRRVRWLSFRPNTARRRSVPTIHFRGILRRHVPYEFSPLFISGQLESSETFFFTELPATVSQCEYARRTIQSKNSNTATNA